MIPVFYINLDSRPERRDFMEEQFSRLGIRAERLPATLLADVPAVMVERIRQEGHLWRINPGDLACGLSHQRIWQIMLARNLAEALVLEDDAVLSEAIVPYLQPGLLARRRAGLIRLETRRQKVALGPQLADPDGLPLRELGSSHKGTAAYLMSQAAARTSLGHPLVNEMAVDRFLFGHGGPHLYRTRILQADPAPAVQLDRLLTDHVAAPSDIASYRSRSKETQRSRQRSLLKVLAAEAGLVLPRLVHGLRVPEMRQPKQEVAFVGDRTSETSAPDALKPRVRTP